MRVFLFFVIFFKLCVSAFAAEDELIDYRNLIDVNVGLGWLIDANNYDTCGDIDTYFPVYRFPEDGVIYFDIDQRVPFRNITGTTRFDVPLINYSLEPGLMKRLRPDILGSVFLRRQGTVRMDKPGDMHLDFIGLSVLTEDYLVRDILDKFEWRLGLAYSIEKNGTNKGALLEGDFIYNLWKKGSLGINLEGEMDTLVTSESIESDIEIGPKLNFYGPHGTINSIVTRFISTHSRLTMEDSGFYLGVAVQRGIPFEEEKLELPFIDYGGTITFGFGESGRVHADIDLLGNIPAIEEGYDGVYFAYEAQSFYLSGGNDNLYYVTIGGLEKEWRDYILGLYFNHRSGHLVDSSNDFEKADLNLYEIGLYSPGWHLYQQRKGASTFGRINDLGNLNFFFRLGTNLDNTFISRWHIDAKIGFRIDFSRDIFNLTPYLSNYDELVGRALLHDTAIGLRNRKGWSYNFKYHYDDQISDTDNGALLLTASKIF